MEAYSQCTPQATYVPSAWAEPSAPATPYTGFMCIGHDTLFTRAGWQYYDGDGYFVNLIAGSDITIYTDSCTASPASLTIVDSTGGTGGQGNIIAGAYVAAACPNSLNFIAPYSGKYFIVYDADNNCLNLGSVAIGSSAIKLNNASSITNCTPFPAPANDSICNAIPVTVGTMYSENTTYASATDERDADVVGSGFACSLPNNTLWYSFTPAVSGDYEFASDAPLSGGSSLWLGLFNAPTCVDPLVYVDCLEGAIPGTPWADTASLTGGVNYYIMIDGFSGAIGAFSFTVNALSTGINEINAKDFSVYPNPFTDLITVQNSSIAQNINVEIVNMVGQVVYKEQKNNLVNATIDTKSLAKGVYFIRFISNEGIATKKLIKQ
ncbi:MAG: T9SS type A sorting domain-containing protein [Bacteroidetes bacterium]|nr:T9SS type A sorting domain-containing protein [Bacteroidota bacterium]